MKNYNIQNNLNEYSDFLNDVQARSNDIKSNMKPFDQVLAEITKRQEENKNDKNKQVIKPDEGKFVENKNFNDYNKNRQFEYKKEFKNTNENKGLGYNNNYGNNNYNKSNYNNENNYSNNFNQYNKTTNSTNNNYNSYNNLKFNNSNSNNYNNYNSSNNGGNYIKKNYEKTDNPRSNESYNDYNNKNFNQQLNYSSNNDYINKNIKRKVDDEDDDNEEETLPNFRRKNDVDIDDLFESNKKICAVNKSPPRNYQQANVKEWQKSFEWDIKATEKLLKYFSYSYFRTNQREIINAAMSGRDVFVSMPTGGGKSVTFQIPAILSKGITIVIMPLISLIQDQYTAMKHIEIPVASTKNESHEEIESKIVIKKNGHCKLKVILTTPEKVVQSNQFKNFLRNIYEDGLLERFVIDEAHCLSKWGNDFRADYLKLSMLRKNYPTVPILALTATAPKEVRDDVCDKLGFRDGIFFKQSYNRPNLKIIINRKTSKNAAAEIKTLIEKN